MIDPDDASRGAVSVCGVVDGPLTQVVGLLVCQVVPVALVEDAVGVDRAGAYAEHLPVSVGAVTVDVIKARSLELVK